MGYSKKQVCGFKNLKFWQIGQQDYILAVENRHKILMSFFILFIFILSLRHFSKLLLRDTNRELRLQAKLRINSWNWRLMSTPCVEEEDGPSCWLGKHSQPLPGLQLTGVGAVMSKRGRTNWKAILLANHKGAQSGQWQFAKHFNGAA